MNDAERSEREHVLRRDGRCVLHIRDERHVCRRMLMAHRPDSLRMLTVEHVKDQPMMGRRAPSDRRHMVAMCYDANVAVPSKEVRAWIRDYLSRVEP